MRQYFLLAHLIFATFFLPFYFVMVMSGTSYLLGFKGETSKELVVSFPQDFSPKWDAEKKKNYFRDFFAKQGIDFSFESIKETPSEYIFRPSHRVHYSVKFENQVMNLWKITPNIQTRLMEIHKGHGPAGIKVMEIVFGISLLLVIFSGLYLAYTMKKWLPLAIVSAVSGAIVFILLLFVF